MQIIRREDGNLISKLDPKTPPIATVKESEIFVAETAHHLYLWKKELKAEDARSLHSATDDIANPLTGPIRVQGAEPGDALVVKLLDIVCDKKGDATTTPGSGLLGKRLNEPRIQIIENDGRRMHLGDGVYVMMRPVVGCIATTPKEPILTIMPGPHGGNLDDPDIATGARIHLPVYVAGANFALGDVHAAQADGEGICGVDISASVTLKVDEIRKGVHLSEVIVETHDRWIINKEAESPREALEKACLAMTEFLKARLSLPEERIGALLSSVGGFHISQSGFYGYPVVYRAEVPKSIDTKGRLLTY
jgi:amidase